MKLFYNYIAQLIKKKKKNTYDQGMGYYLNNQKTST